MTCLPPDTHLARNLATALLVTCITSCGPAVDDDVTIDVDLAFDNFDGLLATDEGYFVTINGGWVTTSELELLPCAEASASVPARTLAAIWPVRTAYAHVPDSPTLIGVTRVERVGQPTSQHGAFAPPPGSWCSVRYSVRDADEDALGLDQAAHLLGRSLVVRGTWARGDATGDFEVDTSLPINRALDLATPLNLAGDESARLTVVRDVQRWFDGLDFERMPPDVLAESMLFNVVDSTRFAIDIEGVADGLPDDPGAPFDPFDRNEN